MPSPFNYTKAMHALRGKVIFNYDLRKSLNPGQKANIRKAFNKAKEYGITKTSAKAHFIKIPRKPKESYTKYKQRVKKIKQNIGQGGSLFLGVYVDAPVNLTDVHYSFKGDKLTITQPKFGYTEVWENIDLPDFAMNGFASIENMVNRYREMGYKRMSFISNGAYRFGESFLLSDGNDYIAGKVEALIAKYPEFMHFLTGVIFTRHTN
jgi:hypothetical protein